ncbi:MAG TPA: nicotinate phosphoribosyltransferase [Chitinispirillaceae bacterium]|nr:nicotinate phosphoribosyltransferase [Chitinispirillaceae bacterium]
MFDFTFTYTDLYELAMSQVYFFNGKKDDKAVFDFFFRKNPFNGGYAVFAGLEDFLDITGNLRFDESDLDFLKENGFDNSFLSYLKNFRFRGDIFSCNEGEIVFASEPVVQIEASIIEAQIIETILLNILNFQTLIATKASRLRLVSGNKTLIDFGLRRAQGPGGYYASRAAIIGGFDATSNVCAGKDYNVPVSGTMAHSFVQCFDNELEAFRKFAENWPSKCVLLVDTYDTLGSGVPNAIKTAKEMEKKGNFLKGIRLDSGDLAYLAKESRRMLDQAGLHYVKIAASNKLNEFVIRSLELQNAPVDIYGVGTNLVTGYPDGAVDGVYKLSSFSGKSKIKLTETLEKTSLPDKKKIFRLSDSNGNWIGADAVFVENENESEMMFHPFEPLKSMRIKDYKKEALLNPVMKNGKRLNSEPRLSEISRYTKCRLGMLPQEYKRFENPHTYKIGISKGLKEKRDSLIEQYKRKMN